ncbi:MAG: sulfotransferase family protein [Myxococcota bacterium]
MSFRAPERPAWVERLIAHGDAVGGAERLVSLSADDLVEAARASTGLDDFGAGDWRTHFDVLLRSLEEESDLHLAGRLLARTEILTALRNRLRLTELWRQRPQLLESEIQAPVFIVGPPRSGTSILHELMACDPARRAPALWEMQHPVEALEGADRAELADRVTRFWHDLQPEYETMHANSGRAPNECIFITLHEFLSDHWSGNHVVPAYESHLQSTDAHDAYRLHARFLKTLQARGGSRSWLLKAPSHLFQLRTLFDVYPDARIVRTHRDPLRTLPSAVSLMGTLKWMRCRRVDLSDVPARMAFGYAYIYAKEMEQRASGVLPDDRFVDVHFADLVRDPVATVADVHRRLGWDFPPEVRRRVAEYAAARPRAARGLHRYSLAGVGLDGGELRERFRAYMERYGVAEEEAD